MDPSTPLRSYVLGFLFRHSCGRDLVTLVEKKRGPGNMAGTYNGVGGNVERGEIPLQSIQRECAEETGVSGVDWMWIGTMSGPDWTLDVYTGRVPDDQVPETLTDEAVLEIEPSRITELPLADGVELLVLAALRRLNDKLPFSVHLVRP